jgi:FKBP-type peptidyl-prolyl cis-trans isomerase
MGYEKTIMKEGTGKKPTPGASVTVHCTGFGKNGDMGVKFWSTHDTNEPFTFNVGLGQVIKAWDQGVMTMAIGEKAQIKCDADFGYGAGGFPAWGIMPNSDLMFEIEVLSIN